MRQLDVDPLVLINFLIDHRARLDGAVRGPGSYFVGPNVALNDLVQAAGGTINWADESGVELITTAVDHQTGKAATQRQTLPLRQATLASYTVRPRDTLHFNQVFTDVGIGSVTVQGEVRFAGSYPIIRGEHLSELAGAGRRPDQHGLSLWDRFSCANRPPMPNMKAICAPPRRSRTSLVDRDDPGRQ